MCQSASVICNSLRSIPCIGDGDTGYGNAMNVKRTIAKYSQAGLAGIMIEDQVFYHKCQFAQPIHLLTHVDQYTFQR